MATTPATQPTCTWIGASGAKYAYQIFENPCTFLQVDGNYIYAKKNAEGKWVPVYIGQGCLSDRCSDGHHQAKCIVQKGATHIHAHRNENESARLAEESDLLANYQNAYEPKGCNVRTGG